jgi:hypothetical protein
MLASTVQFSRYGRSLPPEPSRIRRGGSFDAGQTRGGAEAPDPSGPNSVPGGSGSAPRLSDPARWCEGEVLAEARAPRRQLADVPLVSIVASRHALELRRPAAGGPAAELLLRKEVIQPHLPVRLPCYDLVPIASPTFDGSLHKGWATGFGCCRLS